ncbi:MAG: hypothetical protein ACM33T_10240 [Solirubrobacterales bacterium]
MANIRYMLRPAPVVPLVVLGHQIAHAAKLLGPDVIAQALRESADKLDREGPEGLANGLTRINRAPE